MRYVYVGNNPVNYIDLDGEIGILATIVIGALIGAAINATYEIVSQMRSGVEFKEIQWGKVLIAGVSGALSGALTGSGNGLLIMIGGNAAIAGISSTVEDLIYEENIIIEEILTDIFLGAVAGAIGGRGVQYGTTDTIRTIKFVGKEMFFDVVHYKKILLSSTAYREFLKGTIVNIGVLEGVTMLNLEEFLNDNMDDFIDFLKEQYSEFE